jgi:hypothetical protein
LNATKSRLLEYLKSHYVAASISNDRGALSSREEDGAYDSESVFDYGQRSTQVNHTGPYHTDIRHDSLPASNDCDIVNPPLVRSTNHYDPEENQVQVIVEKAATKVRRGLKIFTRANNTLPRLLNDQDALCDKARYHDEARYYEENLWAQASRAETEFKKLETDFKKFEWSSRFLASCFRLIRINLEAEHSPENQPNVSTRCWLLDIAALTEF